MTTEAGLSGPQPVSSGAGASAYGVQAMYGNVWEWCADGYDWRQPGQGHAGSAFDARVLRGGSWREPADELGEVWRSRAYPQCKVEDAGFRCATDVKLTFES
jgi:formylglycine-generating enzyme required for sulfatase activity